MCGSVEGRDGAGYRERDLMKRPGAPRPDRPPSQGSEQPVQDTAVFDTQHAPSYEPNNANQDLLYRRYVSSHDPHHKAARIKGAYTGNNIPVLHEAPDTRKQRLRKVRAIVYKIKKGRNSV